MPAVFGLAFALVADPTHAAPKAPTNLVAATVSTNQINLSWTDNSNNENGFLIERAPDSGGVPGAWAQIAVVAANGAAYTDTGLAANVTYWYRVRASSNGGDSAYSNQANATTLPLPPSNLGATAVSTNQVDLSWRADPSGESGFKIERAPDNGGAPGSWMQIATVSATITNFSDTGVSADAVYWYRVRANNAGGDSAYSNQATATTPPRAPSNLTATTVSSVQIDLSWTDSSNTEGGFKVERSTDGTNFTQIAQALPNTTSYRDTRAWPGTTYYYRVRGYNAGGGSGSSNVASARTLDLCSSRIVGWGLNSSGETTPPAGLSGVVAIAAGFEDSLALKGDGTVVGWGDNSQGQISLPAGLTGVVAIAANYYHGLALKSDGTVVGWGDNGYGQSTPPAGLSGVVAIAAGYWHSLALKSDGTVVGWGYNGGGEATPPAGLMGVEAIAAGGYHSLALKSDGTVVGWGNNDFGQTTLPAGLTGVVAVAADDLDSLALKSDGTVIGWGWNYYGQATPPAGLASVVGVVADYDRNLALKSDGTVVGWGNNSFGQATPPAGLAGVEAIAAGAYHSLALVCLPTTPSGLTATPVSAIQIDLTWTDPAADEAGFLIERAVDNGGNPGTWTQIATLATNVTTFSDRSVSINVRYWYRVRAYNAAGISDYSNQASAIPTCRPADSVVIITQPVSQSVCTGATASFSVTATGSSLTYQWRQTGTNLTNGGNISGATSATLTVGNVSLSGGLCNALPAAATAGVSFGTVVAGQTYLYQASGLVGVNLDGAYANPDGFKSGTQTGRAVAPASYLCPGLWGYSLVGKINGGACIQLGSTGTFVAANSGTLTLYFNDDIYSDNSGSWNVCVTPATGTANYDAVVSGACNSQTSSVATLTIGLPPVIATPPSSQTICQGQPVTFSVRASGIGLHYVWRRNSTPIGGAADTNSFTIASVTAADAGAYDTIVSSACGNAVTSSVATLTVSTNGPPSAVVSGGGTICAGQSAVIQAALSGVAPWLVSWSDGVTQTNILASPVMRTVTPSSTATYTVTAVSDAGCAGNSSGSATVTVNALPTAAVSGGGAICIGGSTNIQATLTGLGPWTVTWSDGFTQSGVASSPVTRVVSPSSNTVYTLAVVADANCTGTVLGVAAITLKYPPLITGQPLTATVCVGDPVAFSVTAGATASASGADGIATLSNNRRTGLSASASAAPPSKSTKYRPDQILVKPVKGVAISQMASRHAALGAQVKHTFAAIGNLQIVKLPAGVSVEQAINHYQRSGLVEYAEPDYEEHALLTPNDPRYTDGTLWAMNNTGQNGGKPDADIDAPEAWTTRTSANPIIVAVIDTGVRYTHEDLAANMWVNPGEIAGNGLDDDGDGYVDDVYGINAITHTGDPWDDHFHGTHVSGTIGGVGNNGKGVVGVAWNVRIMACKFLNSGGSGYISDAVTCIDYARSKGAKIMSNSWGGGGFSSALRDAIIAARDADIIFVAAAGNNSSNNDTVPTYPAAYDVDNIVAVAATDRNDLLASFSNYGAASVELGAPGVTIYSCLNGSDSSYGYLDGTSMATPHVSGALAMLRAQFPDLTYSAAIAELLATVDPIPSLTGKTISGGRLNLQKLLTHRNPLGYQWFKNGVSLPGATNATYTLPSATLSDAGSYTVMVSNSCGQTVSSNATLSVVNCGVLSVTPSTGLNSTGTAGGTFSPSGQTYSLQNTGAAALGWLATNSSSWLSLSPASGTLAPGISTNVAVTINSNANNLAGGAYSDTVTFTNLSSAKGSTTRGVALAVQLPGLLTVVGGTNVCQALPPTPSGVSFGNVVVGQSYVYQASGCVEHNLDGAFNDPDGKTYGKGCAQLTNIPTNAPANFLCPGLMAWSLVGKVGAACIQLGTTGSFVAPSSGTLTLYMNDDIYSDNSGSWNVCISSGSSDLTSSGQQGGPFSPSSQVYTLGNTGSATLSWTAAVGSNWLSLSATNGTLGAGAITNVMVSVNNTVNALVGGLYSNVISFVNLTNGGGGANRVATLLVRDGVSDAWRLKYFGHVDPRADDQSRAADDPDGDGLSNLQESLAGTDPTNSASAFRILSVVLESNGVRVTWLAGGGKTNVVQATSSVDGSYSANFSDISGIIIIPGSSDTTTNHLDGGAVTNSPGRFYRIRISP